MKTHFEKTGQFSVLSVDDDHVNLLVVEQLLSSTGWKVSAGDVRGHSRAAICVWHDPSAGTTPACLSRHRRRLLPLRMGKRP